MNVERDKQQSQPMRRPEVTTLQKLRLRYQATSKKIADYLGCDPLYVESFEMSKDCTTYEFRQYAEALGGSARLSILMGDGHLFLIDHGYYKKPPTVPDLKPDQLPELPFSPDEVPPFLDALSEMDAQAYSITSDYNADRRDRAKAFSARANVALLRKVIEEYGPVLQVLSDACDFFDQKESLTKEEEALYQSIADALRLGPPDPEEDSGAR